MTVIQWCLKPALNNIQNWGNSFGCKTKNDCVEVYVETTCESSRLGDLSKVFPD